jgi:hypothetical protein
MEVIIYKFNIECILKQQEKSNDDDDDDDNDDDDNLLHIYNCK